MQKRVDITKALLEMVQYGKCEERYVDSVYDAVEMLNAHKDKPETGKAYLCLDDIQKFPIRRNYCDKEHGNEHFINGIETVMEYIELLPRYKMD